MVDQLSEVLELVDVRSVMSSITTVSGHWRSSDPVDDDIVLVALVAGGAVLSTDGMAAPLRLEAGDVAVLNGRSWLTLESQDRDGHLDSAEDVLIRGRVELSRHGRELILEALPPVVHIATDAPVGPRARGLVHRLFREMSAERLGADFAVRQYGQLLLLEVLRAVTDGGDLRIGWLKAMADERLLPALSLIHDRPATRWSVDELARASTMSRTAFAERFREVAGEPPLSYLTGWRMLLARRALQSPDARVGVVGLSLGYSSESAFSNAFKRRLGLSPSAYRASVRGDGA